MATITATEPETAPPIPAYRRGSKLRLRNALIGWSFILPNFIGFGLLTLVPIVVLFYMSFTNWNVFGKADWIGLANFQRLLGDGSFRISVVNTLYYSAMHIPLTIVVSLGLALLLNNKLRGVAFFRTAAFFPYITSIVAIAVVWNLLFSPEYGPDQRVPPVHRHPEPARMADVARVGDARRRDREHVARHGLLHDPVPRGSADGPARAA